MKKIFIAILGLGKGSWGHVARIIAEEKWDQILLISNEWGKENFAPSKETDWLMVNNRLGFEILKDEIKKGLPEGELHVSLISGSGKEHTALIAALRESKKEFKVVILTGEGLKTY